MSDQQGGSISFDDFLKVDIRTGTIVSAKLNPKARVPAFVLEIDFGDLGTRLSSAQLTRNYSAEDLEGKQVVAVMNFEPKRIAGVKSQVLVLGAVSDNDGVVLLEPSFKTGNGISIA
ncbi:MAG: tRNA-binding protein [Thiotrichales bacterium]|nr:tRNA-binding protein [Thiotrichales bacterium]